MVPVEGTTKDELTKNRMKWVRINKAAVETGYTEKAIRRKIQEGKWLQGMLWTKAPDGNIFINLEAVQQWIEGQACVPAAQ